MLAEITFRIRVLSYLGGVCAGSLGWLLLKDMNTQASWAWGLVIGAMVALVLCLAQWGILHVQQMKHRAACERAGGEPLLFLCGKVRCGDFSRSGYMVLTPTALSIFLWSRRPYLETKISIRDITVKYAFRRSACALLLLSDGGDPLALYGRGMDRLLKGLRDCGCRVEPFGEGCEMPDILSKQEDAPHV